MMTRLEKDGKERNSKATFDDYWVQKSDFGIEDRHGGSEKYCDPATRNAKRVGTRIPREPKVLPVKVWIPQLCELETCMIFK